MIHGLRIKDGKATYLCRYIQTSRLKQEEFFGGAKFMKIGDLKGLFGLLMVNMQMLRAKIKVLDMSYGNGTGNTALVYHHGKLLALSEADKPCNAWEEGDEVVLITCRLQNPELDMAGGSVKEKLDNFSNELYEMRFNMKNGLASQRKLSESALDIPRVNESYTGRKSSVIVIDAKTMSADPVVDLPRRVPYGFHAFFVTEEQIQDQAKL